MFIDALDELLQATMMMLFIGGSVAALVAISEWNQSRKKQNRYINRRK